MLIHRIGLVSRSQHVDFPSLVRVAHALDLQIARDLAPLWQVAATVVPVHDAACIEPGLWPIFVDDELDESAVGFHRSSHNQPFARVRSGPTWSLAASHEALEMAVDASGDRLVAATAIRVVNADIVETSGLYEYLVEVCGPSLDPGNAYVIDGVLVADFCTPSFYDSAGSGGARYSYSGRIARPRQVLTNGHLTWFDPATGKLQRLVNAGTSEIVELAVCTREGTPLTGGVALRAFADRQAKLPLSLSDLARTDRALHRRDSHRTLLTKAGSERARLFGAAVRGPVTAPAAAPASAAPAPVTAATPMSPTAPAAAPSENHNRRATDIPSRPASPGERTGGDRRKANSYERVRTTIFAHAATLTLPGILSVRPGLHLGPDGFTNERVVVVKTHPSATAELAGKLPPAYGDIRVEVRPADALERLRARNAAMYLQVAAARHELRAPVFDDALYLDGSGTTVDDATVAAATLGAQVAKRQIEYVPPPGVPLDAVTEAVTLVLHVSPDAGWSELSRFLATNTGNLVVGMHDFTSAHVLKALSAAVSGRRLTMTLDRPAPAPDADHAGDETRAVLARDLRQGFAGAWALTNADPKAPVWVYPNAYHLKVAVRDDDRFWLSSGDWSNGSQPVIDHADAARAAAVAACSHRDWHVVVVSKSLADVFRAHLANDHAVASAEEGKAPAAGVAVAATALPPVQSEPFTKGRPPKRYFGPRTVTVTARVQPLLTPDNYQPHLLALIRSATRKFYLQTQYIHPSGKPGDEPYDALITAVAELVQAGVDVRLVMSAYQTDDWMEKLVMRGIPSATTRRQPGVHNNGIVVDGERVLVGSHNWSADGSLRNRDAGLIIHDATAAGYFEEVFLHDWEHLAEHVTGTSASATRAT